VQSWKREDCVLSTVWVRHWEMFTWSLVLGPFFHIWKHSLVFQAPEDLSDFPGDPWQWPLLSLSIGAVSTGSCSVASGAFQTPVHASCPPSSLNAVNPQQHLLQRLKAAFGKFLFQNLWPGTTPSPSQPRAAAFMCLFQQWFWMA
jgi:hypothetical protein